MIAFLSSPVRVFTAFNRAVVTFCLIAPFVFFRWEGLFFLPSAIGAWIFLTLITYGPKKMIRENTSLSLWFWRHIEVWWINPDTIDDKK